MKIPKRFKLHGVSISVIDDPICVARNDNIGEASYRMQCIRLQTSSPEYPMTSERREQAFVHEMVHHILYAMADKHYDDEHFVVRFSNLLHQALTTAEYE